MLCVIKNLKQYLMLCDIKNLKQYCLDYFQC